MANSEAEAKFIQTKQGQIAYFFDQSNPQQPTVVFLHGLSSNHTTWQKIVPKFHEAGFNTLTLDLRGHGYSDKAKKFGNYKIEVFSQDLKQILDQENLEKIILVGYSFGGTVALEFASTFSEYLENLVLISTNFVSPLKYWHLWWLRWPVTGLINLAGWLFIWQGRQKYIYFQQGHSKSYWHSVWIGLNTMPLSVNFWMLVTAGSQDYRRQIENIAVSTLIMRAKHDPYLTQTEALEMHRRIPRSKFMISDNPKHFLPTYAQEEISTTILKFLSK